MATSLRVFILAVCCCAALADSVLDQKMMRRKKGSTSVVVSPSGVEANDFDDDPAMATITEHNLMLGVTAGQEDAQKPRTTTKPEGRSDVGCIAYTFLATSANEGLEAIVDVWNESWTRMGWKTAVLTPDHAKFHPKYEELLRSFKQLPPVYADRPKGSVASQYDVNCFMRWAAMSQTEKGGFLIDFDVLNAGLTPEIACKPEMLPKDKLVLYNRWVPSVTAGSKETYAAWADRFSRMDEWYPQVQELRKAGNDIPVSDMGLILYHGFLLNQPTAQKLFGKQYCESKLMHTLLAPKEYLCDPNQLCANGRCSTEISSGCLAVHMSHNSMNSIGLSRNGADVYAAGEQMKADCLPKLSLGENKGEKSGKIFDCKRNVLDRRSYPSESADEVMRNPDYYAGWPNLNELVGLGSVTMKQAVERIATELPDDQAQATTPLAQFDLANWGPPTKHHDWQSAAGSKGKLAIATTIATVGSTRNDVPNNTPPDVFRCSILMQYLSLKLFGGFDFSDRDNMDYVIIHMGQKPEDLQFWRKFGIKTVEQSAFDAAKYPDPFTRAAMMRVHVVGLEDYSRVLSVDSDMYAKVNITSAFLDEYDVDCMAGANTATPCTGNYILVRPNETTYKFMKDLAAEFKFNQARGWNPSDPRSGLFVWPDVHEGRMAERYPLPCNESMYGNVTDEWRTRCLEKHATNWIWNGAKEVEGIFAYVYNVSGRGTMRWVESSRTITGDHEFWFHFQAGGKPHLQWCPKESVRECYSDWERLERAGGQQLKDVVIGYDWFWNELWASAKDKWNLSAECPTFDKMRSQWNSRQ